MAPGPEPTTHAQHVGNLAPVPVTVDVAGWALRFDLLSDANRLQILLTLHATPDLCVKELALVVDRSENTVSQALGLLRKQGWVRPTRVGRHVRYRLLDDTVHGLLDWIRAGHVHAADANAGVASRQSVPIEDLLHPRRQATLGQLS